MFIQLLAIFGSVLAFISITLSVAAGLYYVSELIEENLQFSKRFLNKLIIIISIINLLLCLFDNLPIKITLFTLFSNFIYRINLKKLPNINLTNPIFLFSCILAFLNHYFWFKYFNNPYIPTIDERLDPNFKLPYYPSFTEIASFFGICIWLLPFSLFISISSNENGLPISNDNLNLNSNENENVKKSVNLIKLKIKDLLFFLSKTCNSMGINIKFTKSDSSNPNELYI